MSIRILPIDIYEKMKYNIINNTKREKVRVEVSQIIVLHGEYSVSSKTNIWGHRSIKNSAPVLKCGETLLFIYGELEIYCEKSYHSP